MLRYQVIPELGEVGAPVLVTEWWWKEAALPLPALVDSGAARSLLPRSAITGLALRQVGRCRIRGITGEEERRAVFVAHARIAGADLRYLLVVDGGELQYALVGRDILRRFVVQLNGPSWTLDIRPA